MKCAMLPRMGYMGGKGNCYKRIVGAMPPHDVYIETHLGGGSVMRHKSPAARQLGVDIDDRVISEWRRLKHPPCELVQADAAEFLQSYVFTGTEVVYCDPPYPTQSRISRRRYRHDYSEEDHDRLLEVVTRLPCNVILSGSDQGGYAERLAHWRMITFRSGARKGARLETLWMNYAPPVVLHDPAFRGVDFRDRERLKRRFANLTGKIERLSPEERAVFVAWLSKRYPLEPAQGGGGR